MAPEVIPEGRAADGAHAALARLIEDTALICADTPGDRCGDCPAPRLAACRAKLDECGHRFMELLLHHIAGEQALLAGLPSTEAARKHRLRHRDHHQEFVAGYNRLVTGLGCGHPGGHLQTLESLVASWTREHVLVFDAELEALLAGK